MMDLFFQQDFQSDMFWCEAFEADPPVSRSAFVAYTEGPRIGFGAANSGSGPNLGNVNKRMMKFLTRSWHPRIEIKEHEKERAFRHMMNERVRRERQKQSYMALHSTLPFGTKSDKKSIIQMASKELQELKVFVEELKRRNLEVEASLAAVIKGDRPGAGGTKIRLSLPNPASGLDSMVEVLKCLKTLGLKTRTIRSNFSAQEFSTELEIETEMGAAEAEKTIKRTLHLHEVERKQLRHFDEGRRS